MIGNETHDQQRWLPTLMSVAVLGFAIVGAWRWWVQPRRAAAANATAPALAQARANAEEFAVSRGFALNFDDDTHAPIELAWRAPEACVEVYRVRVDEQFRDPSVALFVGRDEQHSSWALALGARSGVSDAGLGLVAVDGLLMSLDDPDLEPDRRRQLWWSAREVGPAAPDFACRQRSWDPLEDALALGWPALPDHRVRVGEQWTGTAVEGRCHETTCVDDQGQFPHDRPCRARAWREQLAGVAGVAGRGAGRAWLAQRRQGARGVALILGDWDDGHDLARPEIGILTSRELLVAEGRPLHAQVSIEQRWVGVVRHLELTRIDDCGGGRGSSGDDHNNRSVVAQIRARLRLPPAGPAHLPHYAE